MTKWDVSERLQLEVELRALTPRLRTIGLYFERRADVLRDRGAPVFQITRDDLIQHVWERLLHNRPPFDREKRSLESWAFRRMEDEFNRVCRERVENNVVRYPRINADTDPNHEAFNVVSLNAFKRDQEETDNQLVARSLMGWLTAHKSELVPITDLIFFERVSEASELGRRLGLPLSEVNSLRRRLTAAIKRFREEAGRKPGETQ